jgi:hypothetical protein
MEGTDSARTSGAMRFYGLLHVAEGRTQSGNLRRTGEDAAAVYFGNAVLLANALAAAGCDFTLLTNDPARLRALDARAYQSGIALREIEFSTSVPRAARYFSAHFKIDVFRWFARLPAEIYAVLIDLDSVALRAPPQALVAAADARLPLVYDISDQVTPAYGEDRIESDLAVLNGPVPVARWYAGEFIAGPPAFFARLAGEIAALWDGYSRNIDLFHHQGDEMLTSAALCRMVAAGVPVLDAGPVAIVGRYWSVPHLHPQKPLAWFERCFLVHLPCDKVFLARRANERFDAARFRRSYRRHLALGAIPNRARQFAKRGLASLRRRPAQ